MQNAEAVPAVDDAAMLLRGLRGEREDRAAIGTRNGALPHDHQQLADGLAFLDEAQQRIRTGAEMLIIVGEVRLLANERDLEAALEPALADAAR